MAINLLVNSGHTPDPEKAYETVKKAWLSGDLVSNFEKMASS